MLTESEAWRTIGEAFEAKAAHPELDVDSETDLADYGICSAVGELYGRKELSGLVEYMMYGRIDSEIDCQHFENGEYSTALLVPRPDEDGGAEVRAMFAYLMAEATA